MVYEANIENCLLEENQPTNFSVNYEDFYMVRVENFLTWEDTQFI